MKNLSGMTEYWLASEETIKAITGAEPGYAGPVGLKYKDGDKVGKKVLRIFYDGHLKGRFGLIAGANKTHFHTRNIAEGRDFVITQGHDLINAHAGDICPQCKKAELTETRGIEVGHIFKLGKKYSEKMGLTVLDQNGKPLTPTMGCYGIGVGRTMATAVEQNHDERGIIWPRNLSPFLVYLVSLAKGEAEVSFVEKLYATLQSHGISTYLDDRDERAGVKFNDAELVGFPFIVTVGKKTVESGKIELKLRRSGEKLELGESELLARLQQV
jgi:prolyl-tRNA synthetase